MELNALPTKLWKLYNYEFTTDKYLYFKKKNQYRRCDYS